MYRKLKEGDRVMLRQNAEDLTAGMVGTVRGTLNGDLGVEFEGYSGAGFNGGLPVVSISTRIDGKLRWYVDLCDRLRG